MPNITLFRDTYETHHPSFLPVETALERIKKGTYKTKVNQLRRYRQEDKDKYDAVKPTLPAFIFQGTFSHRANADIQEPSGFFTADIDKITDDLEALKRQIASDPTVYAVFSSPSNVGIKALFKIPLVTDNDKYHYIFEQIAAHAEKTHHVKLDRACKDVARICYASYDPELIINPDAVDFPIDWKVYEQRATKAREAQEAAKVLQKKRAEQLKRDMKKKNVSIEKLDELCQHRLQHDLQWMIDTLSNASPSDPEQGRHQCYVKCGILAKSMLDGYASDLITLSELESHIASIRSDFRPVDASTFKHFAESSTKAEILTKADIWGNYQEWKANHPHVSQRETPPHPADAEPQPESTPPQEAPPIEEQKEQFQGEEKKIGKATQLGLFLSFRHKLQYNEFTRSPFIDGKEWDENTLRRLHVESVDANFRGKTFVEDVAITECLKHSFNPFTEYFNRLQWDGENHIKEVCGFIHTTSDDFFHKALMRWAVQAIAKVKDGTQNEVLILAGEQNIGKSLFASWLCPPQLHDYFVECGTVDPSDKDDKIMLCSNFIGEIGEMGSTTLKETRALKDFLTKKDVKVRAPYDRRAITRRATTSFIGTENPDGAGFLRDVTGSRRFNVVDVLEIDFQYSKICDINQFWAQAHSLFLQKADVSFSVQERNIRMVMIEAHTQQSEEMEYLLQYFVFTGDTDDMLYATDILQHMAENGYSRNNRGGAMMIAKSLKTCAGIERVRGDRGTEYHGIKRLG